MEMAVVDQLGELQNCRSDTLGCQEVVTREFELFMNCAWLHPVNAVRCLTCERTFSHINDAFILLTLDINNQ